MLASENSDWGVCECVQGRDAWVQAQQQVTDRLRAESEAKKAKLKSTL